MTGTVIFNDETRWVTGTAIYPRLKAMDTTVAAYVSVTPIFQHDNSAEAAADFDNATAVGTDFTLGGVADSVAWTSDTTSVISIADYIPTIVAGGPTILTATKDGVKRTVKLNVKSYSATVNVKKNGSAWTTGAPSIKLKRDTTTLEYNNGASVISGTYSILADNTDTGSNITVGTSAATVTLDYYSVSYTNSNISFASAPTVILGGSDLTLSATANSGYQIPASISVTMDMQSMTSVASAADTDTSGEYYYNANTGNIKIVKVNGAVSISVTAIASPTYALTASALTLFAAQTVGYATAPTAQTVTITNTGNQAITLTQPTSSNYTIGALSTTNITIDGIATFTVQPKTALAVGTHTETINIVGTNSAAASISAQFDVNAAINSGSSGVPSLTNEVVVVNGEKQDAGSLATTTSGGQTTTTITVDDTKLDKLLESSGEKPRVTLASTGSDVTVGQLNGQTV